MLGVDVRFRVDVEVPNLRMKVPTQRRTSKRRRLWNWEFVIGLGGIGFREGGEGG